MKTHGTKPSLIVNSIPDTRMWLVTNRSDKILKLPTTLKLKTITEGLKVEKSSKMKVDSQIEFKKGLKQRRDQAKLNNYKEMAKEERSHKRSRNKHFLVVTNLFD